MKEGKQTISAFRLRLGVFFILLFWIPVWLLSPLIAEALGKNTPAEQKHILIVVALVQTVFGIIGAFITGTAIFKLLKKVPRRQVPKVFWTAIKTGKTDGFDSPA